MLIPLILEDRAACVQPGALALGTGGEGDRALDERPDVRLHRLDVLGQERLLDPGDQPFVGDVHPRGLHLARFPVQEIVTLLLRVLLDRLVQIQPGRREDLRLPAVGRVAGHRQRPLAERLVLVVQLRQIDVAGRSHPLALRAHAPLVDQVAHHDLFALALVGGHRAARLPGRDVERERRGGADVRLAEAAPQHPQHRVGVGDRADRRAGVGAHALLVDDDRGRQPVQDVDLGPVQRRQEPLHERAVGLVDQPLRLRGDGAEHQRRLARSRDAGEHGQPALGDLDADVLQVVLPGALDADQVVAVCGVLAHGSLSSNSTSLPPIMFQP